MARYTIYDQVGMRRDVQELDIDHFSYRLPHVHGNPPTESSRKSI